MKPTRSSILVLVITAAACASHKGERIVLHPNGLLRITGTFSDLRVVDRQGVVGAEIRIAATDQPLHQAVVQFGSGTFCKAEEHGSEPCFRVSNLIVVEAEFDWERSTSDAARLRLALPDPSPYAGTFEGSISDQWLEGTFTFKSGATLPVRMRRGASHWDVDRYGRPSSNESPRTR